VFGRCIDLFDRYFRAAEAKKIKGFSAPLGSEIRERLQQMDWLLTQIRPRDEELKTINSQVGARMREHVKRITAAGLSFEDTPIPPGVDMSREEASRSIALMDELKIFVECFYYFAARTRSVVRQMPELKSFEAAGVRNVRNHLIEHPEKPASRVLSRSFGFGGPNGPILKALRESTETAHPDAGLYANAKEFADNFEQTLQAALRNLA
jgi:hypothetical protein